MQNREGGYPNFRWGCPKLIPENNFQEKKSFSNFYDYKL